MIIVWTKEARSDLEGVYRFLAQVNERAAAMTHNKILDVAASLAAHPKLGKIELSLEDLPGEHRSLVVVRRFKIIYRADDTVVRIIAIFDCRRNPVRLRKIASNPS